MSSSTDKIVYHDPLTLTEKHPKTIDLKPFIRATGSKPIFTRALLQYAADQLEKARQGDDVELPDCYGKLHVFKNRNDPTKGPVLVYNDYKTMADEDPWSDLKDEPEAARKLFIAWRADTLEELVRNAKMPIYVHFMKATPPNHLYDVPNLRFREPEFFEVSVQLNGESAREALERSFAGASYPNPITIFDVRGSMIEAIGKWEGSDGQKELLRSLEALKHTVRITNIVCLGNGPIVDKLHRPASQHAAVLDIAARLSKMYEQVSLGDGQPLKIYAQDPGYTAMDKQVLAEYNMEVLEDPHAFLIVNSGSLVMSCCPSFPAKQILADIAADDPSRCPAAVFWTNAVYRTQGSEMVKGWRKVFDGDAWRGAKTRKEITEMGNPFVDEHGEFDAWAYGNAWPEQMELWARPVGGQEGRT